MRVILDWNDNRQETIEVNRTETILVAAENANIVLPFGCRMGACTSCTGRLITGEVEHQRPPRALKDHHQNAGYILLCIAAPRADCHIDVGAKIQTELVSNPWR